MNTAEVLAANGIVRAAEVVELAAAARLELAAAAVLLVKESHGGRNVWGHDDVPTGGSYDKGGAVTRSNYAAYRRARAERRAGQQGCGPTQLTLDAFQLQADDAGGCWDWRANTLTGFGILAGLIRHAGDRDGFRRYNGSGPRAERYADDAAALLDRWRGLLAGATTPPEEDVPLTDDEVERIARRTADLVWLRPTRNGFGTVVEAQQILVGGEKRTAEILDAVRPPAPRDGE